MEERKGEGKYLVRHSLSWENAARELAMNKGQRAELKQTLKQIHRALEVENLTLEERHHFELLAACLAGQLASVWFPVDWGRRTLMILIFLIGLYGLILGRHILMWAWVALPIFSPRLMGEVAHALGRGSKYLSKDGK